jgi:two-component sensor histidine kinase
MKKLYTLILLINFSFVFAENDSDYFDKLSVNIEIALYSKKNSIQKLEKLKNEQILLYRKNSNENFALYADYIQALIYYNNEANFFKALEIFLNVEKKSKKNHYLNISCNFYIAYALRERLPEKSIFYFKKTIDLFKIKNEKPHHLSVCYKSIGDIYFNSFNDYKKAIFYYREGFKFIPKNGLLEIASFYNNISLCHKKLNNKEKAFTYELLAEKHLKNAYVADYYKPFIYDIKGNLSIYYANDGNFTKSDTLLSEIEKFYVTEQNYDNILKSYPNLYEIYKKYKLTQKIEFLISKILLKIDYVNDLSLKVDLIKCLIDHYQLKGDYEKVYKLNKKNNELLFKINKNEREEIKRFNLLLVEKIFDDTENRIDKEILKEKENRIKKLHLLSAEKNKLLQKQNRYLNSGILLLIVTITILLVFFKLNNDLKKNKKIIEQNNFELTNLELLARQSLKEKELLLKEIHHRVKNNFQLLMSLLRIQYRKEGANDFKAYIEKVQSRIISMSLIHENLYLTNRLDKINFEDYLETLTSNLNKINESNYKNIYCEIISKNIYFDIQISIPLGLIISELYNNILKHAFPNEQDGKVCIKLISTEHKRYHLTISDNGIGINSNSNSTKSFGLELVSMLVEQINGSIHIQNENGTKIIIEFTENINS